MIRVEDQSSVYFRIILVANRSFIRFEFVREIKVLQVSSCKWLFSSWLAVLTQRERERGRERERRRESEREREIDHVQVRGSSRLVAARS